MGDSVIVTYDLYLDFFRFRNSVFRQVTHRCVCHRCLLGLPIMQAEVEERMTNEGSK